MDRVGFRALDFTSSTHMAVSVRFHREDPWERLRLVSAAMPNTPLNLITTGMRFISWVPAGEDVMALSFRLAVRNGIRRFQIADPSNDPASLVRLARMAREAGAEEVVVGLTYSISPAHTHEYYIERANGGGRVARHRPALPEGPGRAAHARRGARAGPGVHRGRGAAAGRAAQPLHDRPRPLAYVEGLRAGIRTLHTAVAPVASGTSNPPAESTLRNLEAEGFARARHRGAGAGVRPLPGAGARPRPAAGRAGRVRRRLLPPPDAGRDGHDHARMLAEVGRPELFDAVLEEVTRVREEMGYPIMVTPVSQFVATQATMNVVSGERWRDVSDEMVRYFLGHYFQPAAPVDPQIADRVLSLPRAEELRRSGAAQPRGRARALRRGHLRGGAAAAPDDAGRAGGRDGGRARAEPAAARRRPGRDPLVRLLGSWPSASRSRTCAWRRATTWWCGAVRLDDVAGSCSTSTGRSCTAAPTSARAAARGGEVLEAIRASGRPLVLFTNGSHMGPEAFAAGLREDGLPVADDELLDAGLQRADLPGAAARGGAGDGVRLGRDARRMADAGVPLVDTDEAEVVFVAHVDVGRPGRDGGRRPRGDERRAAADRELPARLLGGERDHLQPRGDGDGGDRARDRSAADRGRQAVAGGGGRDRRAAGRADRRRSR